MTDQEVVAIRKEVSEAGHRDYRPFADTLAFARAVERKVQLDLDRVWLEQTGEDEE